MNKKMKLFCLNCGKQLSKQQVYRSFYAKKKKEKMGKKYIGPFCCIKCCINNEYMKEIKKRTIFEKYGVYNVSQNEQIKNKKVNTCIKNNGVMYPIQNKKIMKKMKYTCRKKYGVDNVSKLQEIKNKKELKSIQKYGCKNVFQSQMIKEKSKKTCLKKFGVQNFKMSKEELEKSYNSMIKRNKHCIVLFGLDEWCGTCVSKQYLVKCAICNKEYISTSKSNYLSQCPNCNNFGKSVKQKLLAKFIKENTKYKVKTNDKTVLKGCGKKHRNLQIDIYIEQLKLAFQFNGQYWHKQGVMKEKGYHDYKTKCCLEKGIELIHISEKDWDLRADEIKKKIIEKLNKRSKK